MQTDITGANDDPQTTLTNPNQLHSNDVTNTEQAALNLAPNGRQTPNQGQH